ncbi:APC family permease [Melioribacteraceae bacterium 4301-Me]|uniref:APC family permease n=1 Tax=Pyranulibacter aquaticus TaxID=3163344 RepID=UPI00359A1153
MHWFIILNTVLVAVFILIIKKSNFLTYFHGSKWWLTWFAIGIITLMDELTSIYYAPFEAYRFIGFKAIIYIALTSLLIRYLSTKMVEISEILEVNGLKGGGVFSFSYLVWGPTVSFIAISSILVDYVLTATISTVSAVQNGTTFLGFGSNIKFITNFAVVWFIALLNIIGIKENAKFTFGIFVLASFILLNLILGGILNFNHNSLVILGKGFNGFLADLSAGNPFQSYEFIIIGIGSCILAYSGIESVLQTASLVNSWKDIKKAYIFLAFTVGILTPLIALLSLTANIAVDQHETDLIPFFAKSVNGEFFALLVSATASITLIMAVNTAMVASAELIEKIAEKYSFHWLISTNKRQSFYKIHLINASFYSFIIFITSGSQAILAEMYAVGLVASFVINTASLLKYRYSMGRKEITEPTSRVGTLVLFIILLSTFIYIIIHRPYGTLLWLFISTLVLIAGIRIAKTRSPEIAVRKLSNSPMEIIFKIIEIKSKVVNIYFRRPREEEKGLNEDNSVYVSFYLPRTEMPESKHTNHFWLSRQRGVGLFDMIHGLLKTIEYEVSSEKEIHVHFGWPLSSWLDRISISVLVYQITHLPKKFPSFHFHMDYEPKLKEMMKIRNQELKVRN